MKRFIIFLLIAGAIFAMSSCTQVQELNEEEAATVIEVVSSGAAGALQTADTSRSAEETARTLTADFTNTQTNGDGTAVFSVLTEQNQNVSGGLTTADAYFSVEFNDFEVVVTDENSISTTYTLNGTMYLEYSYSVSGTFPLFTYTYEVLCFTDEDDELLIEGGTIDTQLDLNAKASLSFGISDTTGFSMSFEYSGSCNGVTFTDASNSLTVSING